MSDTQSKLNAIESKIESLEDSLSAVRKVTPVHDSTCRSVEEVPKIYDVYFSVVGTAGWLWVGFKWHDRALIVLNTILLAMLASGLFRHVVTQF
jgi:hypothetical protein